MSYCRSYCCQQLSHHKAIQSTQKYPSWKTGMFVSNAGQQHIRKNSTTLFPPPLRSVPRCKIGILGMNPPFQKLFKKMVAFFFFRSSPPFSKPTVFAQNLTPVLNREFYFWGRFGEICKLCIHAMFILTP